MYCIIIILLIVILHYIPIAEIYHFQHERVVDFREMMKLFLAEQIKFYEEVSNSVTLC